MSTDPAPRIAVAYISRTRGVRGEVRAETLTHSLERFNFLNTVVLQSEGRSDRTSKLERWRVDAKGLLLKFGEIDSPEEARAELVGRYVTIASEQLAPLPEGTYYIDELINCAVVDLDERELGRITEVMQMPSTDVYVVQGAKGEILVPAISDFIIEIGPGRVVVQGIEELIG